MTGYRSFIPTTARERVIKLSSSGAKQRAEYVLRGEVVGVRVFHESGEPAFEYALKRGVYHGTRYRWDKPGKLLSAEPYLNGMPHGLAQQWSDSGVLLGTYEMKRGVGIDLWWQQREDGTVYASEVRPMRNGQPEGFEWWLNEDGTLSWERHWVKGLPHGIERCWNTHGRLRRGYPRYFLRGERVNKARYLRACANDPSLPEFKQANNVPSRTFPLRVRRAVRRGATQPLQRKSK